MTNTQQTDDFKQLVTAHAQLIRLCAAGLCQLIALVLVLTAPSGYLYGGQRTVVILLMIAAPVLAAWSLYAYLLPAEPSQPVAHERT
jgi:hypothetical protein